MEYHLLDNKGWKTKVTADEEETMRVFNQLKLGLTSVPAYGKSNERQEGQMVTLIIRRLDDDGVILGVEGFFGEGEATLSHNNRRVEITEELNRLITERLAEAELVQSK